MQSAPYASGVVENWAMSPKSAAGMPGSAGSDTHAGGIAEGAAATELGAELPMDGTPRIVRTDAPRRSEDATAGRGIPACYRRGRLRPTRGDRPPLCAVRRVHNMRNYHLFPLQS